MDGINKIKKLLGSATGMGAIVSFFSLSQLGGCSGEQLLRLTSNNFNEHSGIFILLLVALIFLIFGVVAYLNDKIKSGGLLGLGASLRFIFSFLSIDVDIRAIDVGGWVTFILSLLHGLVGLILINGG